MTDELPLVEHCPHPRARHRHGTLAARRKCGCDCDACRAAALRYEKGRAHQAVTGRTDFTDPAPAREHLAALLAAGVTPSQIEQRSGVNRTMLRYILGQAPGRPAARRIRKKVAAAILTVAAGVVGAEGHGLVDPTGSVRRIRALIAIGWPASWLRDRLGVTDRSAALSGDRPVLVSTRAAVIALYDELRDTPPTGTTARELQAISGARNRAAARGWPAPDRWDDDEIDDPHAEPLAPWSRTAVAAVAVEDLEWMARTGAGMDEAAARLGTTPKNLERTLHRRGHAELVRRLRGAA